MIDHPDSKIYTTRKQTNQPAPNRLRCLLWIGIWNLLSLMHRVAQIPTNQYICLYFLKCSTVRVVRSTFETVSKHEVDCKS